MSTNNHPGNTKLYLAGGVLILLAIAVFAQQAFNLSFIPYSRPEQILLLYTLSTLIFVVLLVFGFILLRTVVKVLIERKQGKPGSRFKTSLMLMLGVLTLIPAISVFAYAYGLVNRSIDRWFTGPVDRIIEIARRGDQVNRRGQQENAQAIMEHMAANLPSNFDSPRKTFRLKALFLMDPRGIIEKTSAEPGVQVSSFIDTALLSIESARGAAINKDKNWIAAEAVKTPKGRKILVGVFPARADFAELNNELSRETTAYNQLKEGKTTFRDNYGAVLALMTVLVLFAAVWLGLFLAKKVTEPIEALAAATREISAGNLNYRVGIQAADELGMLVSLFNDMASRVQVTTEELETRRRYMEVILESIPTGVISIDPDFRIHTLNRAARTMFATSAPERLGDIFKDDDFREILSLLEETGPNGATRDISFRTPGRPAHSAVTACRLSAGGYVLVVEDLTEFVRAQRANAWRDVARRLAHEIKNPLTPIQLSAERIARNVARLPEVTPRVSTIMQECVGAIMGEVASLKHLVDEFVRFARMPAVARVPDRMRELIDRTLALYEGRMDGVTVRVDIPEDLPLILMDAAQMKRVLVNLIDNALGAMSGEDTRLLHISCELVRDGTMARLVLEDSGRGIAPEDRERLFTPYFTTRKEGTGLGLSISSRIVAEHGGYIGAEPNVPRGTRFIIELPVCQESSLSTTSPASGSL